LDCDEEMQSRKVTMKKKITYRKTHIYAYLIDYELLEKYIMPFQSEEDPVTQKNNYKRAPFENAAIAKSDIDLAIKSLPKAIKEAVTNCYIKKEGDYQRRLVTKGVHLMYCFLNGLDNV